MVNPSFKHHISSIKQTDKTFKMKNLKQHLSKKEEIIPLPEVATGKVIVKPIKMDLEPIKVVSKPKKKVVVDPSLEQKPIKLVSKLPKKKPLVNEETIPDVPEVEKKPIKFKF